ncbi:magnesium-translocating P-type ATPase [Mycoplasma sp. Mirounga ES2805-ORL]|uniref:magnesium-translocating P-type ATPase n=1 Tax=Mycoplasma sp. Mirounga ES2805-ORL TaxID=754514 RepID=UPI00197C0473|nr:magnesium-translocating P-type ATPase [Mycoplasma sp. Mirounga ES2805-ORL]QSF13594.1 magnesium-translocating P-type ATPase [Mycoplasma sp. Mirounga ES2805-ORL]
MKKQLNRTFFNSKTFLIQNSKNNINDVYKYFNSSEKGLETEEQIEINKEKFGSNKIEKKSRGLIWRNISGAFFNPFSLILILLSLVSLIVDIILPATQVIEDSVQPATFIIIVSMVIVSGILHMVNESRSKASAEKLVKMIQTTTRVERNGIFYEIPLEEVVAGDIVILAAGDIIPADLRIISAKDLFVSQSSLTGESDSIEKFATPTNEKNPNITDLQNIAFLSSNVISGSAKGIVLVTGENTYLGQVATKINEKPTKTNFEKGLSSISWLLIKIMLTVVPLVFIITTGKLLFNHEYTEIKKWVNVILFTISIAIGLTPEMLPMIVTGTLSRGALNMSKQKTIVKNLHSIQNFGAMDVFCTDKTGTLTLDQIVLEKHLDVDGQENNKVLKYAFLNSYYQTGLKNLLDKTIIEKTEELSDIDLQLRNLETLYEKVDEIPFDFQRKRMTVLVKSIEEKNKIGMITKGAVEEVVSICKFIEYQDQIIPISDKIIKKIFNQVDKLNDQGMRVIAVAHKKIKDNNEQFTIKSENEMVLIGYLAFLDPPKESTESAIKKLHDLGVEVKILTGDNARVTKAICEKVNIPSKKIILGSEISNMSNQELQEIVEQYNIFAKLSPDQKSRIIEALREKGHVVGYMGDGINDAPAMKVADVSISVDTAVDIAKETGNIILLEKDLNVLSTGIVEGRKTYANMNKYVKMTISSNFGNIISILFAAIMLPFVPLLAVQILFLNLIYDFACGAIPWDKVDQEFIQKPKIWNVKSIFKFMIWFGPISSIVDIISFLILRYALIPNLYPELDASSIEFATLFQTGWFIISMWTQSLVIHFIRTKRVPFIQSRPSFYLLFLSIAGAILITVIPYIPGVNDALHVKALNNWFYLLLFGSIALYITLIMIVRKIYIKKYGELL